MPIYSEKVMDHFTNPRNVGEIENADGIGEVGNPVCGDMMTFYIKVKDNRLEDVNTRHSGAARRSRYPAWSVSWQRVRRWKRRWKSHRNQWPKSYTVCRRTNFTAATSARRLYTAIEDYKKKQQPAGQTLRIALIATLKAPRKMTRFARRARPRWSTVRTAARL